MSNVHQLVVELANYEQQRRNLEDQLYTLEAQYNNNVELASLEGGVLTETYVNEFNDQVQALEAQLDFVYEKIDDLQELIDEESEQMHGFHDDDY